jgi:hypothetical protein
MVRTFAMLLVLIGLVGCSDRSSLAAPYKSAWDRTAIHLGLAGLVYQPCYRKERTAYGDVLAFVGYEECFRFNPPERMRGVWLNRGEDEEFLPYMTTSPAGCLQSLDDSVSLAFTRNEPLLNGDAEAYSVEFVGRRATYPGRYGHLGMSDCVILVDQLFSATPVPPPDRE